MTSVAESPPPHTLRTLRDDARRAGRGEAGTVRIDGLTLHYRDLPSLYIGYKDIFHRRIYHFTAATEAPRIIDGGAYLGLSTLYFKQTYPRAKITCFEPDPAALAVLRRNLIANGAHDVKIVEAALSDHDGTAPFAADGADGGTIIDDADAGDRSRVRTVRLSDFLDGPIDFLKLNIEGQEWPVLRDLECTGALRHVRRMVVEYHGRADGRQWLGDVLNLLDRAGFRYLLHDFDQETGPTSKPPFRLRRSPWFCLIYAARDDEAARDNDAARDDNAPADAVPAGQGHGSPRGAPPTPGRDGAPGVSPIPGMDGAPCRARTAIDWGTLRRVTPISRVFGFDRGAPVDRYYIERFLGANAADVAGRVLEVGDDAYTRRFGGDRVTHSDVLQPVARPPLAGSCSPAALGRFMRATIIGDLADERSLPPAAFDCIILTQVLPFIENAAAAIAACRRALSGSGVLLATAPGISQISRYDMQRWGDYWRFTTLSLRRMFERVFPADRLTIQAHGNVLAATAFLQGISADELSPAELDVHDPDYELLITVRAQAPGE